MRLREGLANRFGEGVEPRKTTVEFGLPSTCCQSWIAGVGSGVLACWCSYVLYVDLLLILCLSCLFTNYKEDIGELDRIVRYVLILVDYFYVVLT